jgi:excisionase family DNA binding protein
MICQAAGWLGISEKTVRRAIAAGTLHHFKVGSAVRISQAAAVDFAIRTDTGAGRRGQTLADYQASWQAYLRSHQRPTRAKKSAADAPLDLGRVVMDLEARVRLLESQLAVNQPQQQGKGQSV